MPKQTGGLSPDVLQAALHGLEARKQAIEEQIRQVRSMLGGASAAEPATPSAARKIATPAAPKKRKLSAAGRKRIAEAARKRWAAYNAKKNAK